MRITQSHLRQVIREELERVMRESYDVIDPEFRQYIEEAGLKPDALKPADLAFMRKQFEARKRREAQEAAQAAPEPIRGENARNEADVYNSDGNMWRVKVGDEVRYGGWIYKVTRAGMHNGKSYVSGKIYADGSEEVLLSSRQNPQAVEITLYRRSEMDFGAAAAAWAHKKAMDAAIARRDRG